jgi:hypothetical protein
MRCGTGMRNAMQQMPHMLFSVLSSCLLHACLHVCLHAFFHPSIYFTFKRSGLYKEYLSASYPLKEKDQSSR